MTAPRNPVFLRLRRHLPRPPRSLRRWLALPLFALALTALGLGLAEVPFPGEEQTRAEVIVIMEAPSKPMAEAVAALCRRLADHPGVESVGLTLRPADRSVIETFTSDWPAEGRCRLREPTAAAEGWSLAGELEAIAATPCSRPRLVFLVHPHGDGDLQTWLNRARQLKARDISIGAMVPPAESLAGAWVALPVRQVPVAGSEGEGGQFVGGSFTVMLRNLEVIGDPAQLELTVLRDGPPAGFNAKLLSERLPQGWMEPADGRPASIRIRLKQSELPKQDLDPTVSKGARPVGHHVNLRFYPFARGDAVSASAEGFEAVLRDGAGREVARSYTAVDTVPPRVFYLPLAALLRNDRTAAFWPALPQDPDTGRRRFRSRLAWNLLWRHAPPAGLTVYWPRERWPDDLPSVLPPTNLPKPDGAAAWKPSELYDRLREAGAVTDALPDAATLRSYRAVILDASAPSGLSGDFVPSGDPAAEWLQPLYAGGFFSDKGDGRQSAYRSGQEIEAFLTALRSYLGEGGTLVLLGSNPLCYGPPLSYPPAAQGPAPESRNLRAVLGGLDERLGHFEWVDAGPRRLILAFDATESAGRAAPGVGAFPTLPPLPETATPIPAGVSRYEARRQIDTFLGAGLVHGPAADGSTTIALPGRADLLTSLASALGLGAEDPEFAALARNLVLDSKTDFAFGAVRHLAAVYVHPGLAVEVQGRPVWQQAYPALKDVDANHAKRRDWLFALPFPGDERPRRRRDRYRTVFDEVRAKNLDNYHPDDKYRSNLLRGESADSAFLTDALEWKPFTQYLKYELYPGPVTDYLGKDRYPRDVVLALLDQDDFLDAAAVAENQLVRWPVIDNSADGASPFVVRQTSFHRIPALRGQHFLFLKGPKTDANNPHGRATREELLKELKSMVASEAAPIEGSNDDWWAVSLNAGSVSAEDQVARRLLCRGRFDRLLTSALARDVQALPCHVPKDLAEDALTGVRPELLDLLRRVVHERLRLSFPPSHRPVGPAGGASPWQTLVEVTPAGTAAGGIVPIVSVARFPAPAAGAEAGRVVLAQFDPQYEIALHDLRGPIADEWVDYSATWVAQKDTMQRIKHGYRLSAVTPPDGAGAAYHLTRHSVVGTSYPPLLADATEAADELRVKRVVIHPNLGLGGKAGRPLGCEPKQLGTLEPSLGNATALRLSAAAANDPGWKGSTTQRGLLFWIGEEDLHALADSTVPADPLRWQRLPEMLPPLLEFVLEADVDGGGKTEVSVFAPLPTARLYSDYFQDDSAYASPPVQLVDLLIEMFGRQPRCRVEVLDDRRSFRLVARAGTALPSDSELTLKLAAGGAIDPARYRVERLLRGQIIFRLDGAELAGRRLHLEVGGAIPESHEFLMPASPTDGAWPAPLRPAEAGDANPAPAALVLDTLASVTAPEPFRGRLRVGEAEADEWGAAQRGVLVTAVEPARLDDLDVFARQFIDRRTRVPHYRSWYLVALVGLTLAFAARALARPRA